MDNKTLLKQMHRLDELPEADILLQVLRDHYTATIDRGKTQWLKSSGETMPAHVEADMREQMAATIDLADLMVDVHSVNRRMAGYGVRTLYQYQRTQQQNPSGPRYGKQFDKVVQIGRDAIDEGIPAHKIVSHVEKKTGGTPSRATIRRYLEKGGII